MTAIVDIVVAQLLLAMASFNVPSYTPSSVGTPFCPTRHSTRSPWYTNCLLPEERSEPITSDVSRGAQLLHRGLGMPGCGLLTQILVLISLTLFSVIIITCLALIQPKQSSYHVWHSFMNIIDWNSDAFVFVHSLVNFTYELEGLDGAIHLTKDCFEPARTVLRARCSSLVIGFATAFIFAISMLYGVKNTCAAINNRSG